MGKNKYLFLLASITLIVLAFVVMVYAQPPVEKKIIHSTPPIEYAALKNPLMKSSTNLAAGKALYEANCAPCHGMKSDGKGTEADGFWPPPANFTDPETIAALKENYVFWRITEGGRDDPFESAMPAFGDDFTDEEKWQIIMYAYDNAGVKPKE